MPYKRRIVSVIKERINEQRRFIQIVIGPRQTGKTTAVTQALKGHEYPFLFVEATKNESNSDWLKAQWYRARQLASSGPALLVIDEVQYVASWSAVVKTLWDEDAVTGIDLRVLLTDPDLRGRLVETAVGAYLVNLSYAGDVEVFWWREGNLEVDFVVTCEDAVCAIEVKSGRIKPTRGMAEFIVRNPEARPIVVGSADCPLEAFLSGEIDLFA